MSDRRCLCFFEALDGIRSDGGDVAERQIEVSSFSEADISVSLHAEQCGHPHSGRRTMGFDMHRLGFDPSVWRAFFHTRLWRGVLPAMALAFTVIFLFYCVVGGASESAVMRRALVAAGVCGFGYVVGIWCAVQPDREEEEDEANGGRETISARLKLAGCALAALVLLAYPSIQRFLAGGRSLAECVAEVIVRLMVVACVVFPVWRTVKRRQEENGTV